MFERVRKHIENGGRALYVIYDVADGYIEHLETHRIPYRRKKEGKGADQVDMTFVLVDDRYKAYGFAGLGMRVCLLDEDDGDLDDAMYKFLEGRFWCIPVDEELDRARSVIRSALLKYAGKIPSDGAVILAFNPMEKRFFTRVVSPAVWSDRIEEVVEGLKDAGFKIVGVFKPEDFVRAVDDLLDSLTSGWWL